MDLDGDVLAVLYMMENLEVLERGYAMSALSDFFETGEMLDNIMSKKEENPENPRITRLGRLPFRKRRTRQGSAKAARDWAQKLKKGVKRSWLPCLVLLKQS